MKRKESSGIFVMVISLFSYFTLVIFFYIDESRNVKHHGKIHGTMTFEKREHGFLLARIWMNILKLCKLFNQQFQYK